MRDDFLFHNNINDPSTFVETSLAMRVADSVFKGINAGWINSDYLETAFNIRNAVHQKVADPEILTYLKFTFPGSIFMIF